MGASDYIVGNAPAGASYAAPLVGFQLGQALADLPEEYFKGTQRKRALAAQQPIIDPNTGQPSEDPNTIIRERMRLGGDYSEKMLPFIYGSQLMRQNAGLQPPSMGSNEPSATPAPFNPRPVGMQSQNRPFGAAGQSAGQPSESGTDGTGITINYMAQESGRNLTQSQIFALAGNLRINPNTNLSPDQQKLVKDELGKLPTPFKVASSEDVSPPTGATSAAEVNANVGGGGPTSGGPAPFGGGAPNAVAQTGGGTANVDAGGPPTAAQQWNARQQAMPPDPATGLPPGYTEKAAANWYKYAGQKSTISNTLAMTGNKGMSDQVKSEADHAYTMAQKIRDAIKERAALTNEQKLARDQAVPEFERGKALSTKMGEAQAGTLKEFIEAGRSAQKRIQSLDTIGDALKRGGGNITTGPFAEHTLHAKQALSSLFNIDLAGTPEAEVAQKTGFSLATQAVKEISQRPSQMEFKLAMQNNPGLLLSPKGSFMMIDILKQSARQDIELSKLAQRRENWDNWEDVSDKFYRDHPLKSPFDHSKNLGTDDLKTIGGESAAKSATPPPSGTPPGAKQAPDGNWYLADPQRPGKYLMVKH